MVHLLPKPDYIKIFMMVGNRIYLQKGRVEKKRPI